MSQYAESTTEFKDADLLVQALAELGYGKAEVNLSNPAQLLDYRGRATHYLDANGDKAEIIVRREYLPGAANDLGFRLNPVTGCYGAIISEYDSYTHNAQWLGKLKTAYAEKGIMRQASRAGLRFTGRKLVSGKIQLQFVKVGA